MNTVNTEAWLNHNRIYKMHKNRTQEINKKFNTKKELIWEDPSDSNKQLNTAIY